MNFLNKMNFNLYSLGIGSSDWSKEDWTNSDLLCSSFYVRLGYHISVHTVRVRCSFLFLFIHRDWVGFTRVESGSFQQTAARSNVTEVGRYVHSGRVGVLSADSSSLECNRR
jgi:hypothetical protein